MKKSKRFAAIAIAAVMTVLGVGSAMGAGITYTPVSAQGTKATPTFTETLKLQWNDTPIPNLKYTYEIGQTATPVSVTESGVTTTYGNANAVGGTAPKIKVGSGSLGISAEIDYTTKTESTPGVSRSATEYGSKIEDTLTIDISQLTFSEPGIYRYSVTKTATGTDAPTATVTEGRATNNKKDLYFDVYVEDDGSGSLVVTNTALSEQPGRTTKVENIDDQFPKSRNNLTIEKKVTGEQGSKDQYFEFEVTLSNTIGGTEYIVVLDDADATTSINVYNTTAHTNPDKITVPAGATTVTQSFWLKDSQKIVIQNITTGVGYKIEEKGNEGYTVTTAVTGDKTNSSANDIESGNSSVVVDSSLEAETSVVYTNNKAQATPTGIFLAMGPALSAVVIAGVALVVVGVARRRRENDMED